MLLSSLTDTAPEQSQRRIGPCSIHRLVVAVSVPRSLATALAEVNRILSVPRHFFLARNRTLTYGAFRIEHFPEDDQHSGVPTIPTRSSPFVWEPVYGNIQKLLTLPCVCSRYGRMSMISIKRLHMTETALHNFRHNCPP